MTAFGQPARLHWLLDNDQAEVVFGLARHLAYLVFEQIDEVNRHRPKHHAKCWMLDRREDLVAPGRNQTKGGLYLGGAGIPSVVWTPWGEWRFGGPYQYGQGDKPNIEQFLTGQWRHQLRQVPLDPDTGGFMYEVFTVEGKPLPKPARTNLAGFMSPRRAMTAWINLLGS